MIAASDRLRALAKPKKPVTLRLDADIADHFRTSGRGWQTRIPARPGDPNSRL